jgi:hypothetical protein
LSRPTEADRTRADDVGGKLFVDIFLRETSPDDVIVIVVDEEDWPGFGEAAGLRGGFVFVNVDVEWW